MTRRGLLGAGVLREIAPIVLRQNRMNICTNTADQLSLFPPMYPTLLPMPKPVSLILALAFSAAPFAAVPARAQEKDHALLSAFCDAGNIRGATCKRAKGYPNAPKRGCEVTLTGDRARGKFLASGHPLLVAAYESGCEAHVTDNGGAAVFEEIGTSYAFRGFQPGMQSGNCIAVAKDEHQDRLVCLTGHMGQGIMETGVALMGFTPGAKGSDKGSDKGISMSLDMLVSAEDTIAAYGANVVTCKERPPKYFELSKLSAGPRKDTVTVEAGYADSETFRTACGKGFPKPEQATGDPAPGDAYVPEGREKTGRLLIDLATRKVVAQ